MGKPQLSNFSVKYIFWTYSVTKTYLGVISEVYEAKYETFFMASEER